jgi:hypothetical protein
MLENCSSRKCALGGSLLLAAPKHSSPQVMMEMPSDPGAARAKRRATVAGTIADDVDAYIGVEQFGSTRQDVRPRNSTSERSKPYFTRSGLPRRGRDPR